MKAPGKLRKPNSWTIMVFMVGGPELGPSLDRDQLELERAGSSDAVTVIAAIQKTARSNTDWHEIQPLSEDATPTKSTVVGRSAAGDLNTRLTAFLEFVATNYESKHYALILWAHASGLGFGRLGPGSSEDLIRLGRLAALLEQFRQKRAGGAKLEILGFCACALCKAEFALELRDHVDFLVSSQVGISTLMTWPFDRIVQRAIMSPSVTPETFAGQIVRTFEESYEPPPVALTALDLRKSEDLGKEVDTLSKTILEALDKPGIPGRVNNLCVLDAFRRALAAYPYDLEPLMDFFDFCVKLVEEEHLAEPVRQQAREVLNRGSRSFVVNNARSGPKFGALNGLSILAPDFDDPNWLETCSGYGAANAQTAWLWKATHWVDVTRKVYEFATANPDLNP